MLCSIDLKTAEKYVIESTENNSLSCEISYALRCLQENFKKYYVLHQKKDQNLGGPKLDYEYRT